MKMKKLISTLAALCMTVTGAGVNTYAASQLMMEKTEEEFFNESFAGVNEETVAADFDINVENGKWYYDKANSIYLKDTGYNGRGSILTKNSYDLSDEKYWEFEVVAALQTNNYLIQLGSGYKVQIGHTEVSLFKSGEKLISKTIPSIYAVDSTFTVVYDSGILTVKKGAEIVLTYDEIDTTLFAGHFGVQAVAVFRFDLYSMKLTANTPIEHWVYDEDFDDETTSSLTQKGWVLPDTAAVISGDDSYLAAETNGVYSHKAVSYAPYGNMLSGNYSIKATQYVGDNPHNAYMAVESADGSYYCFYPVNNATEKKAKLVKYDATSKETKDLDEDDSIHSSYVKYKYDIKVYTNDGATSIVADIYILDANNNHKQTVHLEATDTQNPITSGKVKIYWGATARYHLYDFSAYSTVDESEKPEAITKDMTVFSKVFSSKDSYNTLVQDNIAVEASFRNSGNLSSYDVNTYAKFDDEKGMFFDSGNMYYIYDKTNEDYTFNANMYRMYNKSGIRFNCSDSRDTYYQFESSTENNDSRGFVLNKVTPSGKTALATLALPVSEESYTATGAQVFADYKITCDYQEDGSLDITAKFKANGCSEYVLTATDEEPLSGNRIEVNLGHMGAIKRFSITKPELSYGLDGDKPVFEVRFYNEDGKVMTALEPGKVYANTFAMLMEDYKAIAAIYDGNRLIDAKIIEAAELCGNKTELFEAAEGNIVKVFIWDDLSGMVPIINAAVVK